MRDRLTLPWIGRLGLLVALGALLWRAIDERQVEFAVAAAVVALAGWMIVARAERLGRERRIDALALPSHLRGALFIRYPQLPDTAYPDVERGLRQFFHCHLRARSFVAMPSQAVDALWHAFILDTRAYRDFCTRAFGGFLHHSPAASLGRDARRNEGLKRTWRHACVLEGIDPRTPAALPLLFALDGELGLPDGFRYEPDCRRIADAATRGVHCGTELGGGAGDGGSAGSADGGGAAGGGCGGD